MVLAWLAATVSRGKAWPCGEGQSPVGSVIILSAEDDAADTIVPRLLAADADCSKVHILEAVRREDDEGHRSFNLQLDFGHLGHLGEEKWRKIYKGAKVANVEDGHLSEETKRGDGDPFACLKDGSLKLTPTTELWADLDIPPELDQRATRVK